PIRSSTLSDNNLTD
ncbi:unnamed protein product, partial [Rotaria sp. Silwood1]